MKLQRFSWTVAALTVVCVLIAGCGGGSSTEQTVNPTPTLSSLSTESVLLGSPDLTLSVSGTGFVTGAKVTVGSTELIPTSVSAGQLSVVVPQTLFKEAIVLSIAVTNPTPGGGTSNTLQFTVKNPVPVITALSVDTVETGLEQDLAVSIVGTDFVSGATVAFGATQLTPTKDAIQSGKMDITVPAASLARGANFSVTVTNPGPGGGTSNAVGFTVSNPLPILTTLNPADALAAGSDFEMSLIGSKFVQDTTVYFGGLALTPSVVSKGELVVTVPGSSISDGGTVQVRAYSPEPGGGNSASLDFIVNNPVPTVTAASPTSITDTASDVSITLTGSNFVGSSDVLVGGQKVSSNWISSTTRQVTVPANLVANGATSGSISITVSNPAPAGGTSSPFNLIIREKAQLAWATIANTGTTMPGTKSATYFSIFGPVSVNANGLATFVGQSAVSTDSTESGATIGVYSADLAKNGALSKIADTSTLVPNPNTVTYGSSLAKFGGFPSFARVDRDSPFVAFVGTHPPVISLPAGGRGGSSGLYANPGGTLTTAVGVFTASTTEDFSYFRVPDMPTTTAFGAFPDSPAPVNANTMVFKGDFVDGANVGMGIYARQLGDSSKLENILIASTHSTAIPGTISTKFGYIGAPSASGGTAVFVGYNRRSAPTIGGIYSAVIGSGSVLQPLVTIGQQVPGGSDTDKFTQFADAVSFDGRYVGFWAAWGSGTTTLHVTCPTDGSPAISQYCLTVFPQGYDAKVPLNQGLFVYDTQSGGTLTPVATTADGFSDFTEWVFVGTPPEVPPTTGGGGGSEGETEVSLEVPAFVLSPRIAVSGQTGEGFQAAFKAKTGSVEGIYLATLSEGASIKTVADTTMPANMLDSGALDTAIIGRLFLEREGLSGNWLTIGSTMSNPASPATTTSSGLYLAMPVN